jgi:uncharacterized protein (TIGR02246 family)
MNEASVIVERWGQFFNEGNADALAGLYAPGATIWGTLAQSLTTSAEDIRSYFVEAARAGLRVKLGEHVASEISETCAVDAGQYEFSRNADGQTMSFPARYSFVLVKQNGAWMIAHQHSSMLPKPAGG